MRGVPPRDFLAASGELARLLQLVPDRLEAVVPDLLAVMRRVGLAFAAIQISLAHHLRRQAEPPRNAVKNFLDDQHALRPAEPAKGRVRRQIGLGHLPAEFHRRDVIGVVQMEQRAVRHRLRQIHAPSRRWNRDASRAASKWPSASKPTLNRARNGCRWPVSIMS